MRYYIGKAVFWFFFPIFALLGALWWRENTLFMLRHINMALTGKDDM